MCVSSLGLRIFNLTLSPPLWPLPLPELSTKLYAVKEQYGEFPMAIEVTLVKNCQLLNVQSILVRKKDDLNSPLPTKGCMSLTAWLPTLADPKHCIGDAGWHTQQAWWDKNGQKFRIMNLPAEIRLEIFQQVLCGNIYPNASHYRA
jgi:hypothetical protein